MRRISLLTDGIFPYVIGGMQRHSYFLAKYLAQNGVHVDLYHTNQSKFDIARLECFSDSEKKNISSFVIDFPDLGMMPGHYIRESYEYSRRIYELVKKNPPADFIYAKGFSGWKVLEEKGKGTIFPPVGVNFHGYEMFQEAPTFWSKIAPALFLRNPVRYHLRHADYIFSYGGKITSLIRKLGVEDRRIIEAPAGIEKVHGKSKTSSGTRRFVFVGRYERRKGIEELNRVLEMVLDKYDLEFSFVGPVPAGKMLRSPKVKYWGTITDESGLKDILHHSDILVCPSYSEGMPNVILEAMSCGLAVIATDVGAVNSLVDQRTGWLIPSPDPDNIKGAIGAAMAIDPVQLDAMKQNSLDRVSKIFLWADIARKLISRLENASVPH